ncbi:MAG: cytochrome P450, partial [Anaerolineales bacterium]|nr:cytochrome P450 [Anaerolineales bacterium]
MATPTLSPKAAPQPNGWPLLGNLPQLADSSRLQWFKELHDQYGDVVKINAAGRNLYLLNHPDYAKYVLQTNNRNYRKGLGYNKLKPVLGKGLLTSEGDYWRRQRRLAQPAFHRQKIANFGRIMVENTAAMCTQWQTHATSGQPFDVAAEMMRLTLNVVSQALFTTALTAAELQTVGRVFPPLLHETNRR